VTIEELRVEVNRVLQDEGSQIRPATEAEGRLYQLLHELITKVELYILETYKKD
jgi:hypothetical protein